MSKQITVFLSRKITLNRHGHEPVELAPGRNLVDKDVAEHPFVKAHTVDGGSTGADDAERDALRARVAELESNLARATGDANARVAALHAREDDLTAANSRIDGLEKDLDAAEKALAAKQADMEAMAAAIATPPAADAKPAKGK